MGSSEVMRGKAPAGGQYNASLHTRMVGVACCGLRRAGTMH